MEGVSRLYRKLGEFWAIRSTNSSCTSHKFLSTNSLTILLRHIQSTWRRRQSVSPKRHKQPSLYRTVNQKMPPFKHVLARHVCAQYMTVGCAVHKTLSVLHVGLWNVVCAVLYRAGDIVCCVAGKMCAEGVWERGAGQVFGCKERGVTGDWRKLIWSFMAFTAAPILLS